MTIASMPIAGAPIASQQPPSTGRKAPPKRRTIAKLDMVALPEPR